LYPPLLAQLEAAAARYVPEHAVQVAVRAANVVAGVWILEYTLSFLPLSPWATTFASVVLLLWSPGLKDALYCGNVSPLVIALLLWGLRRWPERPIAAGVTLGASLAIKPLGVLAWLLLCCHRPRAGQPASLQLTASGVAALSAGLLSLPGASLLPLLARQPFRHPEAVHDASAGRLAHLLGASVPPLAMFAIVAVVAIAYVRRVRLSPTALSHVCCAAALISQPVIWAHTMLLAYPLLAAALAKMLASATREPEGSARTVRLLCVCLAVLCVVQSELFGDLGEFTNRPLAALLAAVPLTLVVLLARYASQEPRALANA
jgi:hypothetical protein